MTAMKGFFSPSVIESNRFGLNIVRARLEQADVIPTMAVLKEELEASQADLAILRIPAGSMDFARMQTDKGLRIVHADTLVYYARDLADYSLPVTLPEGIQPGSARMEDGDAIATLARRSFRNYSSHYLANPRLDPDLIAEGYAEWACAHIGSHHAGHRIDVARAGERILGFLSSHADEQNGSFEILLNAVDPDYARQGIYSSLLGFVMRAYRDAGFTRAIISTQVWNYPVQRIWARHGLMIERAYDTYHLNLAHAANGGNA